MILGFTGTRQGLSELQIFEVWKFFHVYNQPHGEIELALHGGCLGADAEFHNICNEIGIPIQIYPGHSVHNPTDFSMQADLSTSIVHPSENYFARNRKIVEKCDHLIACPLSTNGRGGTWYTIKYAKRHLVPYTILWREDDE